MFINAICSSAGSGPYSGYILVTSHVIAMQRRHGRMNARTDPPALQNRSLAQATQLSKCGTIRDDMIGNFVGNLIFEGH